MQRWPMLRRIHVVASGKPTLGIYAEWGRAPVLLIQSTIPWTVSEAGAYTAKIIQGAKRGDLPIEQASRFTLVPKLKTARRLGINVNLLALADKLTE